MVKVATGQQMRSAERLLSVLSSFNNDRPVRTIAEIARDLELSPATVRRLVLTLETQGFLKHDNERGGYRLSYEVVRLASVALRQSSLVTTAATHLDELKSALNETVQLTIREGADLIVIDSRHSDHVLNTFHSVGHRYPSFKGSAAGQVLLCDLPADALEAILPPSASWPEGQKGSPQDLDALLELLSATKQNGFALNDGITDPSVWAAAAPVRGRSGDTIAAINLPCPISRVAKAERRAEIIEILVSTASRISDAALFLR